MTAFISILGKRFGRLVVINEAERGPNRKVSVKCDCGQVKSVQVSNLRAGATTSCGCFNREISTKHGLSGSPISAMHSGMLDRCHNQSNKYYRHYGGRGIFVCDAWRGPDGFVNFAKWAMDNGCGKGLDIDRADNDAGYSPENCRFVDRATNINNRRNTVRVDVSGESVPLSHISAISGIDHGTLAGRLRRGYSLEHALSKPIDVKHRRKQQCVQEL